MRKYQKYTLFFVLMVAGALILGGSSVFAKKPPSTEDPNEHLRGCAPFPPNTDPDPVGTCVEVGGYTIRAVILQDDGSLRRVTETDLSTRAWPKYVNPADSSGYAEYLYWAGNTKDPTEPSPPTPSYLILDLERVPQDADPPGAQLPLTSFSCGNTTVSDERVLFKINPNPTLSSSRDVTFTLIEDLNASYSTCEEFGGNVFIQFSGDCVSPDSGFLMMPDSDGQPPFVEFNRIECNRELAVEVQYDRCTGEVVNVWCAVGPRDDSGRLHGPVPFVTGPYIYADVPGSPDPDTTSPTFGEEIRVFQIENMGPPSGTLFCTDDAKPVFMWGDRGYFCEDVLPDLP